MDKKLTISVAEQLVFNIYKDIATPPEVVNMLLQIKESSRNGDLKPLLKALRSVRRDITQIINELR